jgi:hypothetical protein
MADKPREWAWQPISRSSVLKRNMSSASTVEKSTKNCEKTASWARTGAKAWSWCGYLQSVCKWAAHSLQLFVCLSLCAHLLGNTFRVSQHSSC